MRNLIYNFFTKGESKKPTEKTALLELAQPLNSVAIDIRSEEDNHALQSKKHNGLTPLYAIDYRVISFLTLKELCYLRAVSKTMQENVVDYYFNHPNLLFVLYKIEHLSLRDKSLFVRKRTNLLVQRGKISPLDETKLPIIIPSPEFNNAENGISAVLFATLQNMNQVAWKCDLVFYLVASYAVVVVIQMLVSLFVIPVNMILKSGDHLFDCGETYYKDTYLQPGIPQALSYDITTWINASYSLIKTVEGIISFCHSADYCRGIVGSLQGQNNGTYASDLGANVVCENPTTNILFIVSGVWPLLVGIWSQCYRRANSLSEDQLMLFEAKTKAVVARGIDQRCPPASEEILEESIGLRI